MYVVNGQSVSKEVYDAKNAQMAADRAARDAEWDAQTKTVFPDSFGKTSNTPTPASPVRTPVSTPPKARVGAPESLYTEMYGTESTLFTSPEVKPAVIAAPVVNPNAGPRATNQPSGSTAFFSSIMSLIDDAVKENPLNAYYQTAYHFRLFLAGEMDMLSQSKAKDVQSLNDYLQTVQQVTIAESGVTGFNIKDVSIITVPAGNDKTRTDQGTTGTIIISEPNGLSFFDGLGAASQILQVKNFRKVSYYLELTFTGYDENGVFASAMLPYASGGRWYWAITLTTIDAKINEGGGVYTIHFNCQNHDGTHDNARHDIMRAPQPFFAEGDTVKALFADYIAKLNQSWLNANGGVVVKFDGIVTRPVGSFYSNPRGANARDPGEFAMKAQNLDKNPMRNWKFDAARGTYTVNITSGYRIQDFIVDAIKHTEEGQNLAKDNNNVRTQIDMSASAVNPKGHREPIVFTVETVITQTEFDRTSGNYIKHIVFYVIPHYSPVAIASRPQADQAVKPDVQRNIVQALITNGFLRKRYDYVFTGMNTEVIDFDMSFNLNYDSLKPSFEGSQLSYDAFHQNARAIAKAERADDGNASEVLSSEAPKPVACTLPSVLLSPFAAELAKPLPASPHKVLAATVPTLRQTRKLQEAEAQQAKVDKAIADTLAAMPARPVPPPPPRPKASATGAQVNNIWIEDLLDQEVAIDPDQLAIPISFWQSYQLAEQEAGSHFTGQITRDQSVTGSIWAQIYDKTETGNYQNVKLTIRGDPYWLGQSNIERQINLVEGNISVAGNDLPDYSAGQQVLFLYFKYPYRTGEDFKPAFKGSQIFNGLYGVKKITHSFSDGAFKQELECNIMALADVSKWSSTSSTLNGGAGSSPQITRASAAVRPSTGSYVGKSPTPPADYTPGNKSSFVAAFAPLAQQQSQATGVAPEIILAQAGLETGWGAHAPQNNFFGIKGAGQSLQTTEVINGQTQSVAQNFAGYPTAADSFTGYSSFINNNPRYATLKSSVGIPAQAQALQNAGYATDPGYASKITTIAQSITL